MPIRFCLPILCTLLVLASCGGQDDTSSVPWSITDPQDTPPPAPNGADVGDSSTYDMDPDLAPSPSDDFDMPDLSPYEDMELPGDPSTIVALEAGKDHTCALEHSGRMWCWGNNRQHQIDPESSQAQFDTPVLVARDMRQIALFEHSTCGVDALERLVCWGHAARAVHPPQPIHVELTGGVRSVAAGVEHLCAISYEDELYCWGVNNRGQLGIGHRESRLDPVKVPLDDVLQVSAGGSHTCALNRDQDLYCWGRNAEGRVGVVPELLGNVSLVPEADVLSPLEVAQQIIQVDITDLQTCALAAHGVLSCVEIRAPFLQEHDDELPTESTLSSVLDEVVSFGVGDLHGCAITRREEVACWGQNHHGQLGPGVVADFEQRGATIIEGLRATTLAAGGYHNCILSTEGRVVCWGASRYGQLGVASSLEYEQPVEVVFDDL